MGYLYKLWNLVGDIPTEIPVTAESECTFLCKNDIQSAIKLTIVYYNRCLVLYVTKSGFVCIISMIVFIHKANSNVLEIKFR